MSDDNNLLGFFPSSADDDRRMLARRVARKWLTEQEALCEIPHEQWKVEAWREVLTALIERQIHLMDELEVAHCVGREMFDELKLKDGEGLRRIKGRADTKAREYVKGFVAQEHEGYESHLQVHRDILQKGLAQDWTEEKLLEWVREEWKAQGREVRRGRPKNRVD